MATTSTIERWQHAREVFEQALDLPTAQRPEFVDNRCSQQPQLRQAVLDLLTADQDSHATESRAAFSTADVADAFDQAIDGSHPGQQIGAYRLIERIGQGGMGIVFLAERNDDAYRQQVAIKLLRPGSGDPDAAQRFRQERQVLADLRHSHIARLLDGGVTESGRPYLVMEKIDGQTISEFCDHRRLGVGQRLELVRQVASAVQHAHQRLVVHRDIKPSNILVDEQGVPKLLDFGIAKLLDGSNRQSEMTPTTGLARCLSPDYASPEQVSGDQLTTATDVYSLGALAYRLLTGRAPYLWAGKSLGEITALYGSPPTLASRALSANGNAEQLATVAKQLGTQPASLVKLLDGDVDRILAKAMSPDPADRYLSAEHFSEDLRRFLAGHPVQARPVGWPVRIGKFVRRHRSLVTLTALVALLIVSLATAAIMQGRQASRERDSARSQQLRAEQEQQRALRANDFLVELFQHADPQQGGGIPPTLRGLLEAGIRRADGELASQPALQARLLRNIARAYVNLGAYGEAVPLFERSLSLRRDLPRQFGSSHGPEVAESLNDLGAALRLRGEFERAETLSREALRLRREIHGDDHEEVAESLDNLAEALHELGRYEDAEPLYQQALDIRRRQPPEHHLRVATSLDHYALLLENENRNDAALDLYTEALEIRRRHLPESHPGIADSLYQIGSLEQVLGHQEASEQHLSTALASYRSAYGEAHPDVANCLHDLGSLYERQDRLPGAESFLRQALQLRRTIYPENHPELIQSLGMLGHVLTRLERLEEATSPLEEALARSRELFPGKHIYVATSALNLAENLAQRQNLEEAIQLSAEATDIFQTALGPEHFRSWKAKAHWGSYLLRAGRPHEALEHLDTSHAELIRLLGQDHQLTQSVASLVERARESSKSS